MSNSVERSAEWVYQGVWLVLAECFRVPQRPPSLPAEPGGFYRTFHPSRRYLDYLKLYFWIVLVVVDLAILVAWLLLLVWQPILAVILALPALAVAVVPDLLAYVAIHLRYDTMWYVITNRSLRARRGIWVITEHTITFENVQNVYVRQGPIQQLFGIAKVIVETAGADAGNQENPFAVGNQAIIEGIDNPQEIRELILQHVRSSQSTGLGDEPHLSSAGHRAGRQIALLKDIRDEVGMLAALGRNE